MSFRHLEQDRLESLATYDVDSDLGLDRLVELASQACQAPVAFVSLVEADRLRLLARVGSTETELPRSGSFSSWVVDNHSALTVSDARDDARFRQHPWVMGAPFYRAFAGVPLIGRDGLPLGVLCVCDTDPRSFSGDQMELLRTIAESVVTALELRRLDRFAGVGGDQSANGRRLRKALDLGELVTYFQPVVALETRAPHALEALVRWEHPQRGVLGPATFLPLVERSGLSLPVGRRVLHDALRVLADLRSSSALTVAVNVSPLQLAQPGFAASVLAELEAHRLAPASLCVEVTERGLQGEHARGELVTLREAGVRVALDDYGTGRASLRDLVDLPVTSLKLDGSLVARVSDTRVRRVIESTVSLAGDLGLLVVAEGIETEEQREALQAVGVNLGQGHLFSPAIRAAELPALLTPEQPAPTSSSSHTFGADAVEVLADALGRPGPVVLIATLPNRVAIERTLASNGVNCVTQPQYSWIRTEDLLADWSNLTVPAGATVWSDLAGTLWATGDVSAAIAAEDYLSRLPATVICGHESWALNAHGTPQQLRRLHEQHGSSPSTEQAGGIAAVPPGVRDLVHRMNQTGASSHSIAAALTLEGHPSPSGVRWHWRQVDRLLLGLQKV